MPTKMRENSCTIYRVVSQNEEGICCFFQLTLAQNKVKLSHVWTLYVFFVLK